MGSWLQTHPVDLWERRPKKKKKKKWNEIFPPLSESPSGICVCIHRKYQQVQSLVFTKKSGDGESAKTADFPDPFDVANSSRILPFIHILSRSVHIKPIFGVPSEFCCRDKKFGQKPKTRLGRVLTFYPVLTYSVQFLSWCWSFMCTRFATNLATKTVGLHHAPPCDHLIEFCYDASSFRSKFCTFSNLVNDFVPINVYFLLNVDRMKCWKRF